MDELVRQLRERAKLENDYYENMGNMTNIAADVIEKLTRTIEELTRENESLAKSVIEASDILPLKKRWIPVTERLPSREGKYLTAFSKGEVGENVFMIFRGALAKWYYNSEDTGEVTHWMPLPEPPKGD